MSIAAVSSSPSISSQIATQSATSALSGFDSNAFMAILLVQLRNQNPLEPMDDKDLIAQMAQLNSLEELKKISAGIETLIRFSQQA
ncbi:MAG: Flagellar basal-body rod modification protein FlgD [Anaerolineae bacterium]|nr:MAG: Flagellar basal-body rod modification protein FlgD [Anaerolineae bacterium]